MSPITPATVSPPAVLFHYCGIQALKAILETRTFWMGQLSSMNDYMEHSWLRKIALEQLAVLQEQHRWSVLDPPEKRIPSDFYSALELQLRTVPHVDPYCMCFSTDGDVLSQWRAYAEDGKGFAVGFDSTSLVFPNDTTLREVCYDEKMHQQIVSLLIERFQSKLPPSPSHEDLKTLAWQFHSELLEPSMACKNPQFQEEREWRVIHHPILVDDPATGKTMHIGPASTSGFRIRDSQLIHYLVVPFNADFNEKTILRLVLGPKNPARTSRETLDMFLRESGYGHVEIEISKATYR
jgi:Protein of unknown function (DUF2971)